LDESLHLGKELAPMSSLSNLMNTHFILSLLCFSFSIAHSQTYRVEKIEDINPSFSQDVYIFPQLSGGDSSVCARINSFLIKDFGLTEKNRVKYSIFENVWRTPERAVAELNNISYHTEFLGKNLFAVTLSAEFCSAYCEGFEMTYNFDLNSGGVIKLDTLFSLTGKISLLKKINQHKKTTLSKKIAEIRAKLSMNNLSAEEKEQYAEMLELYEDCASSYESLNNIRFVPSSQNLKIILDPCSLHHNRHLDELWAFVLDLNYNEWAGKLSYIGKHLLLD
jgi:hypothetical protein